MPDEQDIERLEFLRDLDDAEHINVSEWEAKFIDSNIVFPRYTPAQREVIDQLREKYGSRL
jgi:hypothetical protein